MSLVNVATLLSKWGKKVLMMDWDLEAPGLENFFKEELKSVDWSQQKGVIEWLYAQQKGEKVKWQDWVVPFKTIISETDLHLFVSGTTNGHYSEMLREFNISKFYEEHDGGRCLEKFREELLAAYDFVLIDSRTGVTDFGGICTIQMPDMLVMPFSPTEQGLNGTEKIARKVLEAHQKMPLDRFKLLIFPVPSRFDSTPEFETSRRWLHRIAEQLKFLYDDWLPADVSLNDFLQRVKIPYIPYFSFGERLPVIEQGVSDPAGLGYAYENLAMLSGGGLDNVNLFMEKREEYLEDISGQKSITEQINPTLNDPFRQVRIFISFSNKDSDIKDQIVKNITTLILPYKNIEFASRTMILTSLGQSRVKSLSNNIDRADIILILLSDNYFIPSSDVVSGHLIATEVQDEFIIIQNRDNERQLIIPIYFTTKSKSIISLGHLSDRLGIDASDVYAYDPVDYTSRQLLPVIVDKLHDKSKAIMIA